MKLNERKEGRVNTRRGEKENERERNKIMEDLKERRGKRKKHE